MKLRVKELRTEQGMTGAELARKVGMSRSYVSEIENGTKEVNGRRLEQFAKALGVPVAALISQDPGEAELLLHMDLLKRLSEQDRASILKFARALAKQDDE